MIEFVEDGNEELTLSQEQLEVLTEFKEQLSTEGLVNINNVKRLQNVIGDADEKLAKVKLNRFTEHLTKSGVAYIMDIVDTILQKQNQEQNKVVSDNESDAINTLKEKIKLLNSIKNLIMTIRVKEPEYLVNDAKLVVIDEETVDILKLKDHTVKDIADKYPDVFKRVFKEELIEYVINRDINVSPVLAYINNKDVISSLVTPEALYSAITSKKKIIDVINADIKKIKDDLSTFLNSDDDYYLEKPKNDFNITKTDIEELSKVFESIIV